MTTTKPLPSIGDTIVTPSGQTLVTAANSYKPLPELTEAEREFIGHCMSVDPIKYLSADSYRADGSPKCGPPKPGKPD